MTDLNSSTRSTTGAILELQVGTYLDKERLYRVVDARSPERQGVARPLGSGASSVVYPVLFRERHPRAVKFHILTDLFDQTGDLDPLANERFRDEVLTLSALSHPNIARIYDSGTYEDSEGAAWQYIVMDRIAGDNLATFMQLRSTTPDQAFDVIAQILRGIAYMHDRVILHGDIKVDNIICRASPTGPEAVIIDLGLSHTHPDAIAGFEPSGVSHRFISTSSIIHKSHRRYLKAPMTAEVFEVLFPAHDLYSAGRMLEALLKISKIRAKFSDAIGTDGIIALRKIIADLLSTPETRAYEGAGQVLAHWQKLSRNYLAPVGVPELSIAAEFKYSMPTSAGRSVITPRLAEIINHKNVQRLHRVPQLELLHKKWSPATHTRFSHSISVLRNCRYYVAHLLNDPNFRFLAEQADLQATLLLGLLHDVGHYQLEHMFEDFASDQRVRPNSGTWAHYPDDIPGDDELFWAVVDPTSDGGIRGGYGQILLDAARGSAKALQVPFQSASIADLIEKNFGESTLAAMRQIHDAIYARSADSTKNPVHLVLAAVLSSDIDADKVSYLREDSERTGNHYGTGVEFDALLGAIRMPSQEQIGQEPVIGITRRGLAAAQSIAINRNIMVGEVYWNHTNRSMTAMVKYLVARLLSRSDTSFPRFIGDTFYLEYEATLGRLRELFATVRESGEVDPTGGLLEGERSIYRTIFSTKDLSGAYAQQLSDLLTQYGFDQVIELESSLVELLRRVRGLQNIRYGEVLVDTPLKERERGRHGGLVYVYNDRSDQVGVPLNESTPLMASTRQQHILENRVCRIFLAPKYNENPEIWRRAAQEVSEYMLDLLQVSGAGTPQ